MSDYVPKTPLIVHVSRQSPGTGNTSNKDTIRFIVSKDHKYKSYTCKSREGESELNWGNVVQINHLCNSISVTYIYIYSN